MKKLAALIRLNGPLVLLYKIIEGLAALFKRYVFSIEVIVVIKADITKEMPVVVPGVRVTVKEIDERDIASLEGLVPTEKLGVYSRRLLEGMTGFIVHDMSGKPASTLWIAYNKWKDPRWGIIFKLQPKEALYFDGYTFPEFRQKNLSKFLGLKISEYLRARGYETVCIHYIENSITQRSVKVVPTDKVGRICVLNVFGNFFNYNLRND
jgi:hypothetical protein